MTYEALAERCERAEGPDRELDARIAHATQWRWDGWAAGDLAIEDRDLDYVIERAKNGWNSIWRNLPRFTDSLDAAMSLVPEGYNLQLSDWEHWRLRVKGPWQAILTKGDRGKLRSLPGPRCDHAATASLAICAAALRAYANMEKQSK